MTDLTEPNGLPMSAIRFGMMLRSVDNPNYGAALADLVARIRANVGNPQLLIVLMQYGMQYSGHTNGSEQASIAWVGNDPHALYVPTHDLEFLPDQTHMTTAGYSAVAARIASMVHGKLQ